MGWNECMFYEYLIRINWVVLRYVKCVIHSMTCTVYRGYSKIHFRYTNMNMWIPTMTGNTCVHAPWPPFCKSAVVCCCKSIGLLLPLVVGQKNGFVEQKCAFMQKEISALALSRVIMHSRKKVKWRERIYWMFWRDIRPIFRNHMPFSSKCCNHYNLLVWTTFLPLFASFIFGLF